MSYGYSDDLRKAALDYYDRGVCTQAEVCAIFGLSVKTLSNWLRQRRETGEFSRRASGHPQPMYRIDAVALRNYFEAHPDAYLHEASAVFGVSPSGIYRACRRLGFTRKKNRAVSGARRSGTRHL